MTIDEEIEQNYANMLLRKAIPNGECLNWHRSCKKGYPRVSADELAHRFIFRVKKGPIGNLFVRHTCDNNLCINPEHLILGTHQDNMDDMVLRERHKGIGGFKPQAFSIQDQAEMARLYIEGYSQRKIAAMYETSQAMVHNCLKYHGERNDRPS